MPTLDQTAFVSSYAGFINLRDVILLPVNTCGDLFSRFVPQVEEYEPEAHIVMGPVVQEVLMDTMEVKRRVVELLAAEPGLDQLDIADRLGISLSLAAAVSREMEAQGAIRSR